MKYFLAYLGSSGKTTIAPLFFSGMEPTGFTVDIGVVKLPRLTRLINYSLNSLWAVLLVLWKIADYDITQTQLVLKTTPQVICSERLTRTKVTPVSRPWGKK